MIKRRDFIMTLVLTIVTCGIYMYYFIYTVTADVNEMSGDNENKLDPMMTVILSIVTCGIYAWYWWYTVGNTVNRISLSNNIRCEETGTTLLLWVVLGAFIGIGPFIAMYFMCKNVNNIADVYNSTTQY